MLSNEPFFLANDGDKACLLLHGLGGGCYEMQSLGEFLYQAGYTVKAFNYPGHESHLVKMPPSKWEQWYQAVEQNYQKLVQEYKSVSIIGFSTGCLLALNLASYYKIKNLVLLSPFLAIRKPWFSPFKPERYLPLVNNFIKEIPRMGFQSRSKNRLGLATFNLESVKSALDLIEIVKSKLKEITIPTLIIQSQYDDVVEPNGASFLSQNLVNADIELTWLEKSNHMITLDIEKEKVFQETADFLAKYY